MSAARENINTDLFSCIDRFNSIYGLIITLTGLLFLFIPIIKQIINLFYCKFRDFDTIIRGKLYKGIIFIVFCCLIIFNFFGLVPFVGVITRTLWFPIFMAFSLWISILFLDLIINLKITIRTLSPGGSPLILIPLLVIIESISVLIRPLSLSIRILANIRAGHIILSLVSKSRILGTIGFSFFEFFVCIVQSCIFVILLYTYNLH